MKRLATACLLVSLLAPLAAAQDGVSAEYTFRVADPAEAVVDCRLRLAGLDGPVALTLPERMAFSTLPEPHLDGDVALQSPGSLTRESPYVWRLAPEGDSAELTWRVPLDHRQLPELARSTYEFPYVAADHGLLATGAVAIAPSETDLARLRVRFELPDGWPLLAPWPATEPGVFAPSSWGALQNDLAALGHWDVVRPDVAGVDAAVAFAPGQAELAAAVGAAIARIVEHEIGLFGRVPNAHYLFAFGAPDMNGYGGSVKSNSMTLFVSADLPADFAAEGVLHLVAHEYHHTWFFGSDQTFDDEELHFVMEGFTDWYAQRVPWELGLFDDATLLRRVEDVFVGYDLATADTERSLVEAGGPIFFEGGDAYTQVYGGGLALALLCELAIARHGHADGLDGFMRQLHDGPRREGESTPGLDAFVEWLTPRAGASFAERVRRLAEQPGRIDLTAAFASVGITLDRSERRSDTSRLQANLQGTTLGGIAPRDAATRVGLLPGDVLRAVNGREVASEREVRDAWARPVDDRIQVTFERAGERRELDGPIPTDVVYSLSPEVLAVLRR